MLSFANAAITLFPQECYFNGVGGSSKYLTLISVCKTILKDWAVSGSLDNKVCVGSSDGLVTDDVDDKGEALVVGNTLSVPVGKSSQGLLVNLFDLSKIGIDVSLSGFLT